MKFIMIPSMYCFMFMYLTSFLVVMSGEDWFLIWMGLEINMMSFLILIYRRYMINVVESCLSYFFIQSVASAFFISMFYLNSFIMQGSVIMILSMKIGAGPFFYWFPSLCSGINWLSCFILMMFQKFLPLMLMFLFIHWIMWFIVIVGLFMGAMGSFNQSNLKQLMAYSSVHHLGWIMLVMMKQNFMWMIYLVLYGFVLMSVVVLVYSEDIIDMSMMIFTSNKWIFLFSMLSMAGIPPFLGFFLKWMALVNIVNMNFMFLLFLVIVSVVMLYIYIRIIYDIFMGTSTEWFMDIGLVNYNKNYEMISVMGTMFGLLLGIYIM